LEQPDQTASLTGQPAPSSALQPPPAPTGQQQSNEHVRAERTSYWLDGTGIPILRATRTWIQYGTVGFAVMCILIGAVEGVFGR
jgi:hypothetical protein